MTAILVIMQDRIGRRAIHMICRSAPVPLALTRQEGENIETEIVYDLHMNDVFISECRVVIRVASKEKAELHII